jgi:hypothetical protein
VCAASVAYNPIIQKTEQVNFPCRLQHNCGNNVHFSTCNNALLSTEVASNTYCYQPIARLPHKFFF